VSRRSRRRRGTVAAGPEAETTGGGSEGARQEDARRGGIAAPSGWGLGVQIVLLVAVFTVVVLVAELAGAANLGVALGIGQIAFAIAVVYLLLKR
jgi:hypothetical protein